MGSTTATVVTGGMMQSLYEALFVISCTLGGVDPLADLNPRTQSWKTYALCAHYQLPVEAARLQYGQSFECVVDWNEDQCGEIDDDDNSKIRSDYQYGRMR
jgi:hypothetical protein